MKKVNKDKLSTYPSLPAGPSKCVEEMHGEWYTFDELKKRHPDLPEEQLRKLCHIGLNGSA